MQLDCKMSDAVASSDETDKIVWLKMPRGEVLALNGVTVTADSRIRSRCVPHISPCWSLSIEAASEHDSGFYVCQTNAMRTKYVYLDVLVPPRLVSAAQDRVDVNASSNASLTCEFTGKPEPQIKWFKHVHGVAKEIEKSRGSPTLHLHVHSKDAPSEFECVADNAVPPTVSKKIFLNIQCKPWAHAPNALKSS